MPPPCSKQVVTQCPGQPQFEHNFEEPAVDMTLGVDEEEVTATGFDVLTGGRDGTTGAVF